jgi:hypothetical protein
MVLSHKPLQARRYSSASNSRRFTYQHAGRGLTEPREISPGARDRAPGPHMSAPGSSGCAAGEPYGWVSGRKLQCGVTVMNSGGI